MSRGTRDTGLLARLSIGLNLNRVAFTFNIFDVSGIFGHSNATV